MPDPSILVVKLWLSTVESLNMNRNYAYFFRRKKIKINEQGIYNIISVANLSIGQIYQLLCTLISRVRYAEAHHCCYIIFVLLFHLSVMLTNISEHIEKTGYSWGKHLRRRKNLPVVFKYLSRCQLQRKGWGVAPPLPPSHHHSISYLIRRYFILRRRTACF